jgi:NAD(P)-dependent dehydrogenase (short-subunit alcohol dehydrogenase family)
MMVGSPTMARFADDNPDRFTHNPLGRAGQPEKIAYGALFLASDESSYVNGAVLLIDGGPLSCPV